MIIKKIDDIAQTLVHEQVKRKSVIAPGEAKSSLQTINWVELNPGEEVPPHTHPDCEEAFIFLTGQGIIIVDQNEIEVSERTLVMVQPGENHQIINPGESKLIFTSIRIKIGL